VRSLLVALGFLTRLPVPIGGGLEAGALSRAAVWFPLVGALVGAAAGGTRTLAELALPATVATVMAVLVAVVLTGALHEDGLADAADGFGAHVGRERRLEIMRDPRNGTFGTLALAFAVLLAVVLLAALPTADAVRAFVLGHVLSRWAILVHGLALPPVRPDGAGSLLRVTPRVLVLATLVAAGLGAAVAAPAVALSAGAGALGVTVLFTVTTRRLLEGTTGDTYGATAKLAELGAYLGAVAAF
jgi:adenosylcobinamide-GDP ribazoletransferase